MDIFPVALAFLFITIILFNIRTIVNIYKVSKITKRIESRGGSDQDIYTLKSLIRFTFQNHPSYWGTLRDSFYTINKQKNISAKVKKDFYNFLRKKKVYLPNVTITDINEIRKTLAKYSKQIVRKNLDFLTAQNYTIHEDVRTPKGNADFIVVGENGIYYILVNDVDTELGTLTIDTNQQWTITRGTWEHRKEVNIEAPTVQNKISQGLNQMLADYNYPIHNIIAIPNKKVGLRGAKNSPTTVLKADDLPRWIRGNKGIPIPQKDIESLNNILLKHTNNLEFVTG